MAKIKLPKIRLPKVSLPKISLPKMNLPQLPRPVSVALLAFASVIVGVLLVFGVDRLTNGGEVLGSVMVQNVDLGGLDERAALDRLREFEDGLNDSPIPVEVAGHTFELHPRDIGFDLDEAAILEQAMNNGRSGNILGQFGWWLGRFTANESLIAPIYTFDLDKLDEVLRDWEVSGIAQPAYPGDVRVEDGEIVYEYPAVGTGIERETALQAIDRALADPNRSPLQLTTRLIDPPLTEADIDAAVSEALALVGDDVTLTNDELGFELRLPRDLLTDALSIERDDSGPKPIFVMNLLADPVVEYVKALGPSLETDPVDAEIVIDDEAETVEIIPSIPAQAPDTEQLPTVAWEAMRSATKTGPLPYAEGHEADFSTEDAEALGINGLIGEFTTFHPCCANRVINIQLIADQTDGALVMPGEVFSLNDHVGQRTTEKGYVCAGALLGNELVEEGPICIGGGTSQFTTTLYNAVFFAGLEDISHQPHSIWFSRYPEGREATLGYRYPELIFRNNTEHAIIIKTSHTATSITVKIYGDNGGIKVEAGLSGRYGHTGIVRIDRVNPDVGDMHCTKAEGVKVQSGSPGWSVTVYRYITYPDGTKTTESWPVRYQGAWDIYEYWPGGPSCSGGGGP